MNKKTWIILIVLSFFSSMAFCSRSEQADKTSFSTSPNDISQLLSTLERENKSLIPSTILTPFFRRIQSDIEENAKRTGNNFGFEYIPLFQHSGLGTPHENANGGEFELFGHYRPFGYDNKSTELGYKFEQKNNYTLIPPGEFREEINSIIKTTSGFEDLKPTITELWLQQVIVDDRLIARAGKLDINSVMNSYAFDSRKFYFLSDVFSKQPAISVPSKALGIVTGVKLKPHIYLATTVADANGRENTSGFNTIRRGQYFSAFEIGYRGIINNPSSDNYHIFIWHIDARHQEGLSSDSGYSIILQKNVNSMFIPFFKLSENQGKTGDVKRLVMGGFGLHHPFGGAFGLLGVGLGYVKLTPLAFEEEDEHVAMDNPSFAKPAHHETAPESENNKEGNQVIFETFYRIQLSPYTQITPDIQVIKTLPYDNHKSKWATVVNLRLRTSI